MFSGPICPMITFSTLSGKPEAAGSRRMRLIGSAAWPDSGGFRSSSRAATRMGPFKTFILVPVSTLCDHRRRRYGLRRPAYFASLQHFHIAGIRSAAQCLPDFVHLQRAGVRQADGQCTPPASGRICPLLSGATGREALHSHSAGHLSPQSAGLRRMRKSQLSTPRQSSLLVTWACMLAFSNSATVKCRCHSLGFLLCHTEYTCLHKRYIMNY